MALTQKRQENSEAMTKLVYALRETVAASARSGEVNIAESLNAMGQAFSSIIAGAYRDNKTREIVIMGLPELIRLYLPLWDKIYADHGHAPETKN